MDTVWKSVLAEVEIEVSKAVFHAMFKNTALVSVADGVATIKTPSSMVSKLIETRYYSLLQKVLKKCLEKEVSIVFTNGDTRVLKERGDHVLPLFSNGQTSDLITQAKKARLRSDFTFENFAASPTNQLAYSAAITVAKNPGTHYNPLFFYGSVGVGKTHLMQAIGHYVLSLSPNKKILYITSEEFTNEFIESIRGKSTPAFRKKFRTADIFLLDDVQFLAGKEKVQEEFFHTFNTLVSDDKQVVFSSDRPPQELEKIEKRLKSRFGGGLTVDIAPPDMELRTAIILIKAKKRGVDLPIEVAKTIAERVDDTRRLEGILNRYSSEIAHNGSSINDVIYRIFKEKAGEVLVKKVSADDVLSAVCSFYGLKPTQLKGAKRNKSLVVPRHIVMFILKTELNKTLVEIGNFLGGRDHTTVLYAVEKIENRTSSFPQINEDILRIKRLIWG